MNFESPKKTWRSESPVEEPAVTVEEMGPQEDFSEIIEYYRALSEEDRLTRFNALVKDEVLLDRKRLEHMYGPGNVGENPAKGLLHKVFAARDGEGHLIGLCEAFLNLKTGECEFSIDRRSDQKGKDIGPLLMERLEVWAAAEPRIKKLWAAYRPGNRAIVRLVQQHGFKLAFDLVEGPSVERDMHE